MDQVLLEEYNTIISALDTFDVEDIPNLAERHQYETFGEDQWDLPFRYNTVEEMLEKTEGVDEFIKNIYREQPASEYPILPSYEELRGLSMGHAIDNGYYRDIVYTLCTVCGRKYEHYKYYRYLVLNDKVDISENRAARIMNYHNMNECCKDPMSTERRTVDEEGNGIEDVEIVKERGRLFNDEYFRKIVMHYLMSKNLPIDDILTTFEDKEEAISSYQVPIVDDESREKIEKWLEDWRTGFEDLQIPRLRFINYNDMNNLNHDRICVYLKKCTSCGHPTTYAYAYYLLYKLGVSKEELFKDFQLYLPCCRMTFMSPTFKPLPYDMNEREDFYEGIGIKFKKDRNAIQNIEVDGKRNIQVKRMNREDIANMNKGDQPKRTIHIAGESF